MLNIPVRSHFRLGLELLVAPMVCMLLVCPFESVYWNHPVAAYVCKAVKASKPSELPLTP